VCRNCWTARNGRSEAQNDTNTFYTQQLDSPTKQHSHNYLSLPVIDVLRQIGNWSTSRVNNSKKVQPQTRLINYRHRLDMSSIQDRMSPIAWPETYLLCVPWHTIKPTKNSMFCCFGKYRTINGDDFQNSVPIRFILSRIHACVPGLMKIDERKTTRGIIADNKDGLSEPSR